MDHKIKMEIREILAVENDQNWHRLFKWLYEHRLHTDIESMVSYADKLLTQWEEDSRVQMAKKNFHFKSYEELSPAVRLIRHLVVSTKSEEWGTKYLGLIGRSPYMAQLKSLTIQSCELYNGTLEALFASPNLKGLERLTIKNTHTEKREMEALIMSILPRQLKQLTLVNQKLDSGWVTTFVKQMGVNTLAHLDLSANRIGDAGAIALANAPIWSRLILLDLRKNRITTKGKEALGKSVFLTSGIEILF